MPIAFGMDIRLVSAFRKGDPILCAAAGLFFVPYPNSVLIIFTLLTCRWPRALLLVSAVSWFIALRILLH